MFKDKRVLVITPHLSTGGGPQYLLDFLKNFKEYFSNVLVVEHSNFSDEYVIQKNKIIEFIGNDKLITLGRHGEEESVYIENRKKLIDIIKDYNPEVIWMNECPETYDYKLPPNEVMEFLYRKDRDYKIVETTHNNAFNFNTKRFIPDEFIFCSPLHMEKSKNIDIPKTVWEVPIEKKTRPNREETLRDMGLNPFKVHVLHVGLFHNNKNQKYIFDIAKTLPNIEFHFIGNTCFLNDCNIGENLKLPNCHIWGERNDVDKFMSCMDIYLFPSKRELNPLTVKEALSWGMDVLVNRDDNYVHQYEEIDNFYLIDEVDVRSFISSRYKFNNFKITYNDGLKFEVNGNYSHEYDVKFYNDDTNSLIYESKIGNNMWAKPSFKYYTKWRTEVWFEGYKIYEEILNLNDKKVLIIFDSKSLGDSIAWAPYIDEFRKKHQCEVHCVTFNNPLYKNEYQDVKFITFDDIKDNEYYATYRVGWYFDEEKNPNDVRTIPLQKTSTDILGLDFKEIRTRITHVPLERPINEKYVTLSIQSTSQCKYWNKIGGWEKVVSFLNIADRAADNRLTNSKPIAGKVNGKYHEGPVTFNEAGDFMIITRNSPAGRNEDGVVRLQLFASHLIDGDWQKPEPLPFNNEAYSVGHASLSKDGKTLYFASNMPGGLGGVDIYKAKVNDDGTYGDPVNLGNRINTEGDEMFPFAHASGELLFFSSNGRVGLGGQDVFLAQLKKDQSVGKVMNLGAPINSSSDDFGLVLSEDQSNGYFSSNRKGGKGSDDVYGFDLAKAFLFGRIIRGTIMDTKGKPLADAEVRLFDLRTGQEEAVHSDEDGFYSFVVEENKSFNLRGQKESYFDANATTSTHITEEFVEVNLKLVKDPGISIYAQITDKFSGKPLAKVKMVMKDLITGENEEVITTASGDYFKPLIGRKLEDKGSYRFVLKRAGYLNKTVDYNAVFKSMGKYEVHKVIDLSMTPAQPGDDMLERLQLNPIHLEKTETDISAEHAVQLDKIVAVLNDNPRLTIQIRVHTDVFGSAQTNQRITEKQAQVIAAYLAERITNPERVTSKGLGESQPTMVDATADGGHKEEVLTEAFINSFKSNDNNEAYEKYVKLSRRVEFVILKM